MAETRKKITKEKAAPKGGGPGRVAEVRNKGGRPKGVPNKLTRTIKEATELAFEQAGGAEYLLRVAKKDHKTFCQLLGKVLPINATIDHNHSGGMVINVVTGVPRNPDDPLDVKST